MGQMVAPEEEVVFITYSSSYNSTGSSSVIAGTTGGLVSVLLLLLKQPSITLIINSAAKNSGTVRLICLLLRMTQMIIFEAKVEYKAGADCCLGLDPTLMKLMQIQRRHTDPKRKMIMNIKWECSGWITTYQGILCF